MMTHTVVATATERPVSPNLMAGMLATIGRWRARAHQRRQLAELTPDMLKDIGVTLADAYFEARKPFWRE